MDKNNLEVKIDDIAQKNISGGCIYMDSYLCTDSSCPKKNDDGPIIRGNHFTFGCPYEYDVRFTKPDKPNIPPQYINLATEAETGEAR